MAVQRRVKLCGTGGGELWTKWGNSGNQWGHNGDIVGT